MKPSQRSEKEEFLVGRPDAVVAFATLFPWTDQWYETAEEVPDERKVEPVEQGATVVHAPFLPGTPKLAGLGTR